MNMNFGGATIHPSSPSIQGITSSCHFYFLSMSQIHPRLTLDLSATPSFTSHQGPPLPSEQYPSCLGTLSRPFVTPSSFLSPSSSPRGHTVVLIRIQMGTPSCVCLFDVGLSHWIDGTQGDRSGEASLAFTLLPALTRRKDSERAPSPSAPAGCWHVGL